MSRISQTPCPAQTLLDPTHRRISSFELFGDDTTTNIDYTRAIDQPLTGMKPRRRSMLMGPPRKKAAAPVTIFEDVSEEQEMDFGAQEQKAVTKNGPTTSRSTLLSKPPAKRAPGIASSGIGRPLGTVGNGMDHSRTERAGNGSVHGAQNVARPENMATQFHGGPVARPYQASMRKVIPARVAHNASIAAAETHPVKPGTGLTNMGSTVRKPPRRQTIFVPEDTTVMSIHPGPRDNTSRIDDSFHLPNRAVQRPQPSQSRTRHDSSPRSARGILHAPAVKVPPRRQSIFAPQETRVMSNDPPANDHSRRVDDTMSLFSPLMQQIEQSQLPQDDIVVQQKPLRRPRQSLLAPPKRLPLRETPSTENVPGWDLAGANTGKENIPPAGQDVIEKGMKGLSISESPRAQSRRQSIQPRIRSSLYAPTQASQHRQSIVARDQAQLAAGRPKPPRPTVTFKEPSSSPEPYDWRPAVARREEEVKKVREFVASKRSEQQTAKLRQYRGLEGELSQPALYEDQWLSYRETALTEVINVIFDAVSPAPTVHDETLMEQLISLYNRPETTLVHDQVRASLQYGALASPQPSVSKHQPCRDRGLQQQLLDFWFETYDHSLLMAAAQVVCGRRMPSTSNEPQSTNIARREFFKDFFVTIIDSEFIPQSTDIETDTIRWQKTMLRSLMLIWLLDQSAEARIIDGGCLLNTAAIRKSSAAILRTLGALMLPACGDIMRALKHLGHEVSYHQDPLDEVVYHIENIAMDFRDGIHLTCLVEALLYKDRTQQQVDKSTVTDPVDDFTLACNVPLPGANDEVAPNTLSLNLKLPALTPTHRVHNIQVALDALEFTGIATGITAEDILDGHRERTLNLLWTLISSYEGLSYLVDWKVLAARVGREQEDVISPTAQEQEDLLQQWASARSDMEVKILSTSFTSGKVYEQILRSFSPEARDRAGLEELMRALGCFSESFVQSLVRSVGVVVSKETVVCHLAILAGNLLKLSA